jgi:hypothetical protein
MTLVALQGSQDSRRRGFAGIYMGYQAAPTWRRFLADALCGWMIMPTGEGLLAVHGQAPQGQNNSLRNTG